MLELGAILLSLCRPEHDELMVDERPALSYSQASNLLPTLCSGTLAVREGFHGMLS